MLSLLLDRGSHFSRGGLLRIFTSDSKLRWRLFVNSLFGDAARAAAVLERAAAADDDESDPNDTTNDAANDGIYRG